MWEKRGDVIDTAEDLVQAIKTLTGYKGVYWTYPTRGPVGDDPLIVVGNLAHVSQSEWGGQETVVVNSFSVDVFTSDQKKLEHFVKTVKYSLLSNDVRIVGRTDGRSGASTRFSAHLTVRAAHNAYGQMHRGP